MTPITEEKRNELLEAAKPLIKFLADNFHPHVEVTVTNGSVELLESVVYLTTEEFIND
jgi:predicted ATP-binding protein involved in virulence